MKKTPHLSLIVLAALLLAACQTTPKAPVTSEAEVTVTVSILPQAYFVERIGSDKVAVNVMVGPGEEAHTYEPTPEQMKSLNNSPVFFSIGVEYEDTWIPRFEDINPDLMIVDSTEGIERIPMIVDHTHHEEHEEGGEMEEGNNEHAAEESQYERLDPHVWLSPANGKIIAKNILDTLIELAPEHAATFQENYESLIEDIDTLNADIHETLSGLERRSFMVFHPAWGYFAHDYNLEQIPVQVGGQDPSPAELANLVEIAKEENIRVIFIQPTFSAADAEALAEEIKAEVAVVDPLAKDWLTNMKTAAEAFEAALSQ